jgi:hypothetical protein
MESNPVVDAQVEAETRRRAAAAYRYPYRVVCVFLDAENSDFPIIQDVKAYCDVNNVTFFARQYNAEKYEEDVAIFRLPAFHIYHKKHVFETHYYDTNPVYKIQLVIWAYRDEERDRERARVRRQERWEAFKALFALERFKRRPALDLDASLRHQVADV